MAKKTTQVRMYKTDIEEIKLKFPNVKMPDFIHMSIRSNPFIQAEALLRGKDVKKKKPFK